MKKLLCILILVFNMALLTNAQMNVSIVEENRSMSKGSFNALVLNLPGTTAKQVQKTWNKFIKDYKGKVKYDKKTGENFSDNSIIKEMSENTVDIIGKVLEKGTEGTELTVWFNLGVTYLSSKDYPERYPAGEKVLKNFAMLVSADMIAAQLKEEEKKLKDLEDELKTLEKAKASEDANILKQQEIIAKAEANIKESEDTLEQNKEEQDTQNTEITTQTKIIEEIKQQLKKIQRK